MIDKKELKELTQKIAENIYKETVSHDPLNRRLIDINVAIAPLIRIIKEQQREYNRLKRVVEYRHEDYKDRALELEDFHGDDPCEKFNYHDGHRAGKLAGQEEAYKTIKGEMK